MSARLFCFPAVFWFLLGAFPGIAQGGGDPRFVVHLLSYIRADYGGAVAGGRVASQFEYDEQREFVRSALESASQVPAIAADAALKADLEKLGKLVDDKGDAAQVAEICTRVERAIIAATGLEVAPSRWPDMAHGKAIYDRQCASCHGATGQGDGPSGASLDPKPTNFHDAKMDGIPPFQAFNTIRLGVPGTGMPAFGHLPDREVWNLAFYVVSVRYGLTPAVGGTLPGGITVAEAASHSDDSLRGRVPAGEEAKAWLSRIRTYVPSAGDLIAEPLRPAKDSLNEALRLAGEGSWDLAKQAAVVAYLEGLEPMEPRLRAKDSALVLSLETKMADVRTALSERAPLERIRAATGTAVQALTEAEEVLRRKETTSAFTFTVTAGIVLREAFEAMLILVTLLGVLRSIGSRKAALFVHGGWMAAVGVGLVAWFFSGWLVHISGAQRETLEGVISLLAVIVLLYVGFWLHRRTEIGKWRAFISEMVTTAVDRRNLYVLGGVAFMAVFREAFETVLFLRALEMEAGGQQQVAMVAGVLAAFTIVLVLGALIVRFSVKIPVRQLFTISSVMMVLLSVVLVGKSMRAFQETGMLSMTSIPVNLQSELIGLYPTYETMIPQLTVLLVSLTVWLWSRRPARLVNVPG